MVSNSISPPYSQSPSTGVNRSEQGLRANVLVTGATGFLGMHLVDALYRRGDQVRAFVHKQENVCKKLQNQAEICIGDLRDPTAVRTSMMGIDYVYHCAAITDNHLPWQVYYDTNVQGTQNVFDAVLINKVKKVVYTSSVAVYGYKSPENRLVEEDSSYPLKSNNLAHYMQSKIEAEKIAMKYHSEMGLPITILRLGILFGPGSGWDVGRGLFQLGKFRVMLGSGHNRLPYTYIENAVNCILLAADSSKAIGQIFNVVDSPPITVRDFMKKNMKIIGKISLLVPTPTILLRAIASILEKRAGMMIDPIPPKLSIYIVDRASRDLVYDTKKAKEWLGWEPVVSYEEGFRRIFEEAISPNNNN